MTNLIELDRLGFGIGAGFSLSTEKFVDTYDEDSLWRRYLIFCLHICMVQLTIRIPLWREDGTQTT